MGLGAERGSRDLYEVLEVAHSATEEEIRVAFRRLAAENHPDKNPDDPKALLRFKRINAAYQVLVDPVKRADYDELTAPVEELAIVPATRLAPEAMVPVGPTPPSPPLYDADPRPPRREGEKHRVRRVRRRRSALSSILPLLGALIVLCVIGIGLVIWRAQKMDEAERADQEAVGLTAEYRPEQCGSESPIVVAIVNTSTRIVRSVDYTVQAFAEGDTDPVGTEALESKTPIRPGRTLKVCGPMPSMERAMSREAIVFRAERRYVRFYAEREAVPASSADVRPAL